jgi:membrane associated rhomboid family serine protease
MGSPRIQPFIPRWTTGRRSVVTLLIVANVLAFLGQSFAQMNAPGLVPDWLCLGFHGLKQGYAWQLVTFLFIHGMPGVPGASPWLGFIHLFINTMVLYFVGREVEAIAGPRHMLGMYFLGGIAGGIAQILVFPGAAPIAGSSSGVFAVLLAFSTILPEYEMSPFSIIPIRIRAKYVGWLAAGGSVAMAAFDFAPGVAHVADLGGCMVGWMYARQLGFGNPWWFQRRMMERRQREQRLERMSPDQYMTQEIDPILDKIARDGIRSLTRAERRILERGSVKISQKDTQVSIR